MNILIFHCCAAFWCFAKHQSKLSSVKGKKKVAVVKNKEQKVLRFIEVYYSFILEAKPHQRKGESVIRNQRRLFQGLDLIFFFVIICQQEVEFWKMAYWKLSEGRECNEHQDCLKFCPCHQIIIFYHSIDIRSAALSK